ncbi:jacalin-like lectin, partial [Actinoplanes philippinensis]|uniref:jacalin-like lectin n=1 Tax=Actinoplanes philippinensis TaxID=35752 RepID=UPI0033F71FF6
DHFPVSTSFTWSTNPAYEFSEQFGGPHGDHYNDIGAVVARPATVGLRAGSRVDQVSLGALAHGGAGGTAQSLTLGSSEYVTSVLLCRAAYGGHTRIFYAKFTTNLGRSIAGGTTTPDCVTRTAPSGFQIAGFHGRSGTAVDKLGFIYSRR